MALFRRFLQLSLDDKRLALRALWLVIGARLALRILPFTTACALFNKPRRHTAASVNPNEASRRARAITVVARLVPGANCLPQALALQRLLLDCGLGSELRIGVAKGPQEGIEAHAWVEHDGVIVIGGKNSPQRYHTLPGVLPGGATFPRG